MEDSRDFDTKFTEVFQPMFFWGVGALELGLVLYTLYMEFVEGSGPSLLTTVLPLSVLILVVWAIAASLISVAFIGLKNRNNRAQP